MGYEGIVRVVMMIISRIVGRGGYGRVMSEENSWVYTTIFGGAVLLAWLYWQRQCRRRGGQIYMLGIACYKAPDILRVPSCAFEEHSQISGEFNADSVDFQRKILQLSGLGERTAFPMCFRYLPAKPTSQAAWQESTMVLTHCMQDLLTKTGVDSNDIGVLVVNCSTFSPAPSLASMMVNHFKLPPSVKAYNIAGMGCSASGLAVDLARQVLIGGGKQSLAVVLSTENITRNWYSGNKKTMLVSNCIFRVGASAVLLSNRPADKASAKYRLECLIRTDLSADDEAYGAIYQEEDAEGRVGFLLSKELRKMAAHCLRLNMTTLARRILPYRELLKHVAVEVARRAGWSFVSGTCDTAQAPPLAFKASFQHFCIHSGGPAIINAVQKGLNLSAIEVEASYSMLHRFGNTSSSTTWYQFQYLEAKGRIRRGDRVWQIALGSGVQCNSSVWIALFDSTSSEAPDESNAWSDCLDEYPLQSTIT